MAQNFGLDSLSNWNRDNLPVIDFEKFNDIWGWHDGNGREYAIMGSLDSVYFIEVTDPKNPILRDVKAGKAQAVIHRDFKTYQQYCYAVGDEGNSTLQIFDMSYLPDSVHKVYDSDEFMYRTHNIFIDTDKLYLGTCRVKSGNIVPMRILSLKNPTKPSFLLDVFGPDIGGTSLFREVHDMFVKNDTIYCSTGDDGLYTLKYSVDTIKKSNSDSTWHELEPKANLINWGAVVSYPGKGYNHSSWLSGNSKYLAMADETHGSKLKLIEFTWYDIPDVKSTFGSRASEGSMVHNPFMHKKKVYVSYYHEGVVVFDIENPNKPELIAQFDTYPDNTNFDGYYGCWGVYPFLPSGNIIASDQLYGLFVFNLAVGVPNVDKDAFSFQVFPNPSSTGSFKIKFSTGSKSVKKIKVYTTSGQLLFEEKTEATETVLNNFKDVKAGVYILQVSIDGQILHKTLLVE